jgi:hypothetical protein
MVAQIYPTVFYQVIIQGFQVSSVVEKQKGLTKANLDITRVVKKDCCSGINTSIKIAAIRHYR